MVPSQIESLEWLEFSLSERALWIEHDSPIDHLHVTASVDTQTSSIPQLTRKRPNGFLLVCHNQ
jgi:hypothetical protein